MDNKSLSARRQNLFIQNLLALGFDIAAATKEHKIAFDKKMFSLPNKKAFEVVSYLLFSKLNEVSAGKYSIIWPLVDTKDQRQFQKTSFEHLTRIAQESEIKFPLVLNSVFSSFGGEAFFDLYFAFSIHVVLQVNKTFGPMLRRPTFDPKFTRYAIEMLKLTSISSVEKFQALTDATKFHLETYFHIAKKLADCVERLKLSNSRSKSLLDEKIMAAIKIFFQRNNLVENSLEGLTMKNKEYQAEVEVLWRKLEEFFSTEEKLWSCISSELEDSTKPILKGSACSFSLSNNLKDCYEERYGIELPEEENNLCIPRFLKLFSLVLEFYVDSIKKGNFPDTYKFKFLKDTSELDKSLKMLQSSCILLEEGNVVNRTHVDALMEKINLDGFTADQSVFIEDLPPSPEECLKSSVDIQNANECIFFYPSLQDVKLDEKIKEVPQVDSSLKKIDEASYADDSVFSSIEVGEFNSVTSLNNEVSYSGLNQSANEGNFSQTSSKSSVAKDLVLNFPEFDVPLSWLNEESLNSQTLNDQTSFSFLD